jgi:hypothetical protein
MMKKKIGVFTLTNALNYGAFYQMFALQQFLKQHYGDSCTVIVFSPIETFKGKLVMYLSFSLKRFYRKSILRAKFRSNMKTVAVHQYTGEHLDIAFFGSDEIWNVENKSFPNDPNFFGIGVNAVQKIAFAPSIGFAKIETFGLHKGIIEGISQLDAVLYRDEGTRLLGELAGQKVLKRVMDPTIIYDDWIKHMKLVKRDWGSAYIAYYSYSSEPPFLEALLEFSREQNLPIVSAGYNTHEWASYNLCLSPWEFLSFLKDAEFIFTTTFHGTIMSTLLGKKVLFSPSSHKVRDFSEIMGLEQYEISEQSTVRDLERALHNYDHEKINLKKNELKRMSRDMVKQFLKL